MTNTYIDAFLAVLEYGTLSAAAEHLYLSQSTLSSRILALEKEIGAPLFFRGRGKRRLELTPAGRQFIPIAERWDGLWKQLHTVPVISERQIFRLCTFPSISGRILADTYFRFVQAQPSVQLRLSNRRSAELYHMVETAEADAALIVHPRYTPKLTVCPLFQEPYYYVSLMTDVQAPVDPRALDPQKEVLLPNWDNTYAQWHDYWFGSALPAKICVEGLRLLREFLCRGDSWAILPAMVAREMQRGSNLSALAVASPPPVRTVCLLTPEKEPFSSVVESLIACIRDCVQAADFTWVKAETSDTP